MDIRIFGKSENQKFGKWENPSLARAVASLARTGNTIKYLGAFLRMGILKKFRRTDMSYFSPPPGSQQFWALFILTGGSVGRWVGGSVGKDLFFFAFFSKTTRYILLATFGPPTRRFKTSVVKK